LRPALSEAEGISDCELKRSAETTFETLHRPRGPSMKNLHLVSAAIELGAGLALLACPSLTAMLLVGEPLAEAAALTVARLGGAGLFALGLACWFARGDVQSGAARGLVAAMLFYNVAAAAVLAAAGIVWRLYGVALWPAVVLHAVMAVWCVASLRR
jgi:hypothetical protein